MGLTAIVAGSTGMIGKELIQQLCTNPAFSRIIALVRRPGNFNHPAVEELVVDYDKLEDYAGQLKGDIVFSCIGTTKQQTPDQKDYFIIDHDYPVRLAQITQQHGARQFHIISSIGANARSSVFYVRMKGETEHDIAAVPFETVHIYRPSFLDGERKEQRWLEKAGLGLFAVLKPLLVGRLRKYRSITGQSVATAMIAQALKPLTGTHIYESDEIQRLADAR